MKKELQEITAQDCVHCSQENKLSDLPLPVGQPVRGLAKGVGGCAVCLQ